MAAFLVAQSIDEFSALITDTTATDEAIWPTSTLAEAPIEEQWAEPSKLARSARGAAGCGPKHVPTRLAKQVRTPPRALCVLLWRILRVGDLRLRTPSPKGRAHHRPQRTRGARAPLPGSPSAAAPTCAMTDSMRPLLTGSLWNALRSSASCRWMHLQWDARNGGDLRTTRRRHVR